MARGDIGFIDRLDAGPHEAARAGGKGAALSRLVAGGFAVPQGFVINTIAFQHFVAETGLANETTRLLPSPAVYDRNKQVAAASALHTKALEAVVPLDLRDEVLAAYAELQRKGIAAVAVPHLRPVRTAPGNPSPDSSIRI
ncbi:MAG: hypothetical protein GEU75_08090 [Dehalococcoidia bacterium]|nr:hypothetical protein [Dehalococcoidia bacterium]